MDTDGAAKDIAFMTGETAARTVHRAVLFAVVGPVGKGMAGVDHESGTRVRALVAFPAGLQSNRGDAVHPLVGRLQ